jgi:hypothetical protein
MVGFDPCLQYVRLLRARFGGLAFFFWDALGGDSVGVVWRPQAFLPRPFHITNVSGGRVNEWVGGCDG